ncbi:MAG: hypothetical protein CL955_06255 [Erythrobacteraceae bacterium]|nr:hypothetical protein [Erythrobacteraceae bacterium]
MKQIMPLFFLLGLAACGSEAEAPADTVPAAEATAAPTDDSADDTGDAGETVEDALANRIPTRFQGVWDYVGGSCDPASDLRMEISGSEILFYESIGQVTGVSGEGDEIVVTLAMEGEGETWEQATRLALVGEGSDQRLETGDGEQPRTVDEYPSKRCPA